MGCSCCLLCFQVSHVQSGKQSSSCFETCSRLHSSKKPYMGSRLPPQNHCWMCNEFTILGIYFPCLIFASLILMRKKVFLKAIIFSVSSQLCIHAQNGRKCQYVGNCSFAHSPEEREMWTFMKENKSEWNI